VGQFVYSVAGSAFTVAYLALDYVDWPAARRGLGVGERVAFFRKNALPMLGFGAGVWVFLFVPFLNLLFMPAAVAGGTRLFLDLIGEDEEGKRE
jgi:CysZ protein